MAEVGDTIYQVSGTREAPRRFFATRETAERFLREELGASFDEQMGWYLEDEAGNIEEYFSIDEFVLG